MDLQSPKFPARTRANRASTAACIRRLHPPVAKGIKPFVKRNRSVLKLQLLDFRSIIGSVIYR